METFLPSLLLAELDKPERARRQINACRCREFQKVQMALHLPSNYAISAAW